MRLTFEERFWRKVDVRGTFDCWEWIGSRSGRDYGQMTKDGKPILAHRASWEINFGPIPPGLFVCHKCDNPPCVNPGHLFTGTHNDNMRDRTAKGRFSGEWNSFCKLSDADVEVIRSTPFTHGSGNALAAEYGVNRWTISAIRNGHHRNKSGRRYGV